ncbi:hypothetical protein CEXT_538441 [Caerostris extrusa]|uniref:Uncharacterized protein n=1 Tax=Caerostris extrusa TaxID=172846 RepID=A0AAV4MFA2_CAEEX|nr:hypothetical protein CEXT_538441 [Caerostris extrusa]
MLQYHWLFVSGPFQQCFVEVIFALIALTPDGIESLFQPKCPERKQKFDSALVRRAWPREEVATWPWHTLRREPAEVLVHTLLKHPFLAVEMEG